MFAWLKRAGDERVAEEQAALRRVATLVARGAPPDDVFAGVAEEAGRVLGASSVTMARFNPDGSAAVVVASWSRTGAAFPAGSRWSIGGQDLHSSIFHTRRPTRFDNPDSLPGQVADAGRQLGIRAAVGVPVSVEGQLWGALAVESQVGPLPAGTEERLAGFTELAATAIANAQARVELRGFAEEQAALRRVATLVAQAAPPAQVLTAVAEEAGRLLKTDHAAMGRYGPGATVDAVAAWDSSGAAVELGARTRLGGQNMHTMIFQTRRPARFDDHAGATGPIGEALLHKSGLRAAVGVPVSVEGRLWGVMVVASRAGPLPAGTEARLTGFTELAGTAIANAEAQAALAASRARIVATADATRHRFERNLHDGAQQRLVSLALDLRAAQAVATSGTGDQVQQLDRAVTGVDDVLQELREIARGLHPAILSDGGLQPALKTLARRSAVPVDLDIQVDQRLPEPVEIAAYYTVSEALANAAKHACATAAGIHANVHDGVLHVRVRDNGRGGAGFSDGSGLVGLKDRAEALGGQLRLQSPPGAGTTLEITVPLKPGGPELPPESR
jgi:signal transduction histidine kinase